MMLVRYLLSLQNAEGLLIERGIDIAWVTMRFSLMRGLRKFAALDSSIHNHFKKECIFLCPELQRPS